VGGDGGSGVAAVGTDGATPAAVRRSLQGGSTKVQFFARGLDAKDSNGKSDPYFIVCVECA
jgi:hypothetical protein